MKIWEGIKKIINIKPTNKSKTINLNINGNLTTDKIKIAKELNTFFSMIPAKIHSKIVPTNYSFLDTLKNPNINTVFLPPTTTDEIETTIKYFNERKATGPNSIPTKILKSAKKPLAMPLRELINLVFETGKFPVILKTAKVIPTFKKGDPLNCNNYRPISLLSNIGKLEKLMDKQVYIFLEQNNCLYTHQFGFTKKHSTNHALIQITHKIRNALDENKYICGVFLDFQKAFDTVNHKILFSKLNYYGIEVIALSLLESYLTNRKQFVHVNDTDSDLLTNTYGVPQG